jgi:hypothetical protein
MLRLSFRPAPKRWPDPAERVTPTARQARSNLTWPVISMFAARGNEVIAIGTAAGDEHRPHQQVTASRTMVYRAARWCLRSDPPPGRSAARGNVDRSPELFCPSRRPACRPVLEKFRVAQEGADRASKSKPHSDRHCHGRRHCRKASAAAGHSSNSRPFRGGARAHHPTPVSAGGIKFSWQGALCADSQSSRGLLIHTSACGRETVALCPRERDVSVLA